MRTFFRTACAATHVVAGLQAVEDILLTGNEVHITVHVVICLVAGAVYFATRP